MSEIRLATRRSPLALAQANRVARLLEDAHPGLSTEIHEVTTTGDVDRTTSVTALTEVGAFVRSVQQAVIDGEADMAVHSCKDLPVAGPDEITAIYPERESPWDVLCGHDLESLPPGARVGTGSPRRAAQMRLLRPDVEIADIRGNVETRLGKVDSGDYDAVILAEAGIRRLKMMSRINHRFSADQMVPAPSQAALVVESLSGSEAHELLQAIEDPDVRSAVQAERTLLARTGAGCRSALGALGALNGSGIEMIGFVDDDRGPRFAQGAGETPEDAAGDLQRGLGL